MLRQHQPRSRVRGAQHAVEPLEHPREPVAAAQEGGGALEPLRLGGLAHALVDLVDQPLPRAG